MDVEQDNKRIETDSNIPRGNIMSSWYIIWYLITVVVTMVLISLVPTVIALMSGSDISTISSVIGMIIILLPSVIFYGYWWKKIFGNYYGYVITAILAWVLSSYLFLMHVFFFIHRNKLSQIQIKGKKIKPFHWLIDLGLLVVLVVLVVPPIIKITSSFLTYFVFLFLPNIF